MKIAIAGYGVEGKSSFAYFTSRGHNVTILDERLDVGVLPPGAAVVLGPGAFTRLERYDMVIRTPSLSPRMLAHARKVWSATNEFFDQCPVPIVGVTGSKGKGTTCSLIASILREAGYTVHLVGNIGVAALDVIDTIKDNDVVVYELSSFQLWDIETSPSVAVILMIEPDHLDIHADIREYVAAKSTITQYQRSGDTAVYHAANDLSRSIGEASSGQHIPYPAQMTAHVNDDMFYYNEQQLCSTDSLKLPGAHNLDNACAAIDVAWLFTQDVRCIEKGLAGFDGLPHRLKLVRRFKNVEYYDDSIATTPGSTIAALRAFIQPKIIILGGSSKGADFAELAAVCAEERVKLAITIGDEADTIESVLKNRGVAVLNLGTELSMNEIVVHAQKHATDDDIVLLSPACASFDMFKSYADRGDQFVTAVEALVEDQVS